VINGEFRWDGGRIFLSHALNDELIGLHCCDDRYWGIYFGALPLAILDSFHLRLLNAREVKRFEKAAAEGVENEG
jgi:hypothetical protein